MTSISHQLWIIQSGTELNWKVISRGKKRWGETQYFYLILTVADFNSVLLQDLHPRQADGDAAVGKQRWWVYPDGWGIVDQSCEETTVTRLIQWRYNQHYFQGKDFDLYNRVSFFNHVYLRLQTPETLKPKGFRNTLGSSHKYLLCLSPSPWNGA